MAEVTIENWNGSAEHIRAFDALNREWLEEFFVVEPTDEKMFADPKGYIIDKGGDILFARVDGEILGVVALLPLENGLYELSKMGVTKRARGLGIGRKLCEALIAQAKIRGIKKLYIVSNRKLEQAITLYKNLGFIELPEVADQRYQRGNIALELFLTSPVRGEVAAQAAGGGDSRSIFPEATPSRPSATLPPNGGGKKLDPTRYGDWELKGKCVDF